MGFWKEFLRVLDLGMETPQPYGWFHLLWFVLAIEVGILLCVTHRHGDDRRVRRVVLWVAISVILLEIYKQVNYSFSYEGDVVTFDYQWYAFPFQFCSMPMYVGLLAGLTKKGRLHRAMCAFLATYAIFAGVCVMFYPVQVFIGTVGINIQTMICHGSMITVGIYLLYTGYVKTNLRTLFRAMAVFASALLIAVALNESFYRLGVVGDETFNMFFVSAHFEPSLPVYSLVQAVVPYPISLIIYFLGFSAAAFVVLMLAKGILALLKKRRKKVVCK